MVMRNLGVAGALLALLCAGCEEDAGSGKDPDRNRDFRQDMMNFVVALADWARETDPNFIVIPQNGQEVYSEDYNPADPIDMEYFAAIDGSGREDLFYGYEEDNVATPASVTAQLMEYLDVYRDAGKTVMVIDYIDTPGGVAASYNGNDAAGYVGFAADSRNLETIPSNPSPVSPHNYVASTDIAVLSEIANFLYIINPSGYPSKSAFLGAVGATNHDLVLVDAFDQNGILLTSGNVNGLKMKADGADRLAISYMSIGEAEDYRYYWDESWEPGDPSWLDETNPAWLGNYKVRYWDADWQAIVFGNADSYLQKILDAGFDGVYLDIIDAFEYWESKFN